MKIFNRGYEPEEERYFLKNKKSKRKEINKRYINRVAKTCLYIARDMCPKDTTNMANNAIYIVNKPKKVSIVWDEAYAYYLPYVNEGKNIHSNSQKVQQNKGFMDRSMAVMTSYIISALAVKINIGKKGKQLINSQGYNFKTLASEKNVKKTRNAPLFTKIVKDINQGNLSANYTNRSKPMITRLLKSMKKYQTSDKRTERQDFSQNYEILKKHYN